MQSYNNLCNPKTTYIKMKRISLTAILLIVSLSTAFGERLMGERVYLHFDNTSYYKGERIWWKAYVVNDDLLSDDVSGLLYVELVNPVGWPVEVQKHEVKGGAADGSFLLKDTLNAGFYEVRAYTSWMLNFTPSANGHGWASLRTDKRIGTYGERLQRYLDGNDGIFSRVFPIYDDSTRVMRKLPKITSTLKERERERLVVNFYPEGGSMVKGLPCRVAFSARNQEGREVSIEGQVRRGDYVVARVRSEYAGRGVMEIPADNHDLTLHTSYNGKDYTFALPEPQDSGVAVRVEQRRATILGGKGLTATVGCRGKTLRRTVVGDAPLPLDSLPTGVNYLTIADTAGHTLARRLFFVNNHDLGQAIGVARDSKKISFTTAPSTTFSLAITDAATRERTTYDGNIMTDLLLSSELRGYIHNISHYLKPGNERDLDLLMMVQGWTRYDPYKPPTLRKEHDLSLYAQLLDTHECISECLWKPYKQPRYIFAELETADTTVFVEQQTLDDGRFVLHFPKVYGEGMLSLSVNRKSYKEIGYEKASRRNHIYMNHERVIKSVDLDNAIRLLNAYSPLPKDFDYYEMRCGERGVGSENTLANSQLPTSNSQVISHSSLNKSLPEVVKRGRRKWHKPSEGIPIVVTTVEEMMRNISNAYGRIEPMRFYPFENRMLEMLGIDGSCRETDNGIPYDVGRGEYLFPWDVEHIELYAETDDRQLIHQQGRYYEMALRWSDSLQTRYFIEESGGYRSQELEQMNAAATRPYAISFRRGNAPTTSRINYDRGSHPYAVYNEWPESYNFVIKFEGYAPPVSFFSQDYSRQPLPNEPPRRTLYWNPNITTDTDGRATVPFHSDKPVVISAEGITADGIPIKL